MSNDNAYGRILQFVWGNEVLDITNDYGYRLSLDAWQPAVGRRSANMLGGRSVYEPVQESLPIQIRADSPDGVMRAIDKLNQMLEAADIFYQYEVGNPVVMYFRSKDAQIKQPLASLVRRSLSPIRLPSNFINMVEGQERTEYSVETAINFERDGQWLYPAEVLTSPLASTYWQNIYTFSFVNDVAKHSSPAQYALQISTSSTQSPVGFVVLQSAGMLDLRTTPSSGTNVPTPETGSTSGNVFRVSATDRLGYNFTDGTNTVNTSYHVFVKLRVNSGSWRIRACDYTYPDQFNTPYITLSGTSPQVVYLGIWRKTNAASVGIQYIEDSAGTLDIDSVLIVGIDENTNVVGFTTTQTTNLAHVSTFGAAPLSQLVPFINLSDWDSAGVSGDLYLQVSGASSKVMPYLMAGTRMNPHTGAVFLSAFQSLTRWVAQPGVN